MLFLFSHLPSILLPSRERHTRLHNPAGGVSRTIRERLQALEGIQPATAIATHKPYARGL